MTLEQISDLIVSILGGLILLGGVVGLVKGWWGIFHKFERLADKSSMFIDEMFPDLLGHMCSTGRLPQDSLIKWTKLVGSPNFKSSSPMRVTDAGRKLASDVNLESVFSSEKDRWVDDVAKKLSKPASKYDAEEESIKYAMGLFQADDKSLNPVKDYLFNNPGKVKSFEVMMVLGLLIRDYLFEKHKDLFSSEVLTD